jgi:glycosyltransferase involved in cell wall biosynthesis
MTAATPRRYRIGIDARFFRRSTGGFGRYTQELLRQLLPMDTANDYVIFLTEADLGEWDVVLPHVRVVVVPFLHFTAAEQTKFAGLLYREKLDLVHFLNFNHPLLYRRPFVVTLHDLTMFLYPPHGRKIAQAKKIAFSAIFRRAMRAARRVIAISEHSALDASKRLNIPHAKMEVIYEAGPAPVRFLAGSKDAVQQYLGNREPYFLFVSQMRPHKGVLTLIQAFEQAKQAGLPHKLVLIGNPENAPDDVRTLLTTSPYASDIITPGFAPEELMPALFHYATCFVMPSEYEGFGLPILEAFAYQVPVLSSDASSLPEVVGDAGSLFPARDAAALSALLLGSVGWTPAERQAWIDRGLAQLGRFSWERCAEQTIAVYRRVLEKGR